MCKLRISDHPLRIESGRHSRTPLKDRTCEFCNHLYVENEIHFLLDCILYKDERQALFETLQLEKICKNTSKQDTFRYLMACKNEYVVDKLCNYVSRCLKKREETATNSK